MGLLGVDAGIVWVVAGVWTVRAACGDPVGLAWGTACVVAGLRWGTLAFADVEAATRVLGPTVLSGGIGVRVGAGALLAAALLDEARIGGVRARTWAQRAAAILAIVALGPLYVVEGPQAPVAWWAGAWAAAAGTGVAIVVLLGPRLRALSDETGEWAPVALAVAGAVLVTVTR